MKYHFILQPNSFLSDEVPALRGQISIDEQNQLGLSMPATPETCWVTKVISPPTLYDR